MLALPSEPWRRNQYAVFVAVFVSWLGFSFVQPFLPLYVQELGVTDLGQVALLSGIALGVAPLLSGLLAPFWGIVADRYGVKIMVQRALICFTLFNTLLSFVVSPWQLLALRAGMGFFGGFGPMSAALVTLGAPPKEVGPAIGRLQAIQIFAGAVGPSLGGLVADRFGIRTSFLVTAALCGASFVLMTFLYREDRSAIVPTKEQVHLPVGVLLALPGFLLLAAILFISQFVERGFGPIIPLFVAQLDPLAPVASTAGLVFSIGLFVSAGAASQIGRLINSYGVTRLLPVCLIVGVVGTVPLFLVTQVWQLTALRVILGISTGTIVTIVYAAVARMVPERSRTTAFSFLGTSTSMASALGPVGAGAITALSLRATFALDAILYVSGTFAGFLVTRILQRPVDQPVRG